MTKEELMALLRNPDQTGQAIDKLNHLIDEYPYFHTGHQLYIRGLRQADEKKMAFQLKKTALCVRDRDVLYHYIYRSSPEIVTTIVDMPETPVDTAPVEIRDVYSEKQLVDDLIKTARMRTDLPEASPQENPVKEETNAADDDKNRRWTSGELIDFFLRTNPKIIPNDNQNEVDLSESLKDSQEAATETLADIYAVQGHKDKAIEIYEQLILKYPEKHIYFAAQIERLKE